MSIHFAIVNCIKKKKTGAKDKNSVDGLVHNYNYLIKRIPFHIKCVSARNSFQLNQHSNYWG